MINTRHSRSSHRSSLSSSSVGGEAQSRRRSSTTQLLAETVAIAANSSRKINTQAANIAQLRLSNLKLHGRDDDIKLLRRKLREFIQKKDDDKDEDAPQNKNEPYDGESNPDKQSTSTYNNNIILVSGTSGSGKSALIHKGLGEPAAKHGYAFASGKFDEKSFRPLSAFSDAMTSLAKHIMEDSNRKGGLPTSGGLSIATLIRDQIRDEFDEEDVEQLRRVLPGCADLLRAEKRRHSLFSPSLEVGKGALARSTSDSKMNSFNIFAGKESISQMHYAIRRLLKIICSNLKGVVLFIDDLQWSDTATLDLLKSIVLDGEIPSLLVVGAYREDEVPDQHPLVLQIRDLEQMNVGITKVMIGNLDVNNVTPLVAEVLGMEEDDNKVKSLAETIHKKTDGNPFFVLMFLRSLYDEKLLQYNFGAWKWTWDDGAVNSAIVTENVASVLVNKMNRLQEETQRVLMVASCLGATFRISAVLEVMKSISQVEMRSSMRVSISSVSGSLLTSDVVVSSTDQDASASSIEELEEEGLCEVDNEEGHFVHDQIQSAAYELICPDQRDSFRGRIGSILLQRLSPEELEASLFEVVGLLNCAASSSTDEERDELARMNLKAGIKASGNAAFDAAKVYFKAGRKAIGARGWEGDHSLMLDICSHGANAYYVSGDFDTMNELIEEVLSKEIDAKEKFIVSDIKVRSLLSTGKHNESIDVALDFRRQLGLPTLKKKPASKFVIIREYTRVRKLLKNKTAEDIANLPMVIDERYEMGQRMNQHIGESIFQIEPTMLPLIIFEGVTTSLKHGLDSSSSYGFAGLSSLLCGPFGKPHEGLEMAKAAEMIIEKSGMREFAVDTLFVTQGYCYHWISPLQDTIDPLLKGYQIGLETGGNEGASWCLHVRSNHLYYLGRPLDSIQKELETTIPVLEQLKQDVSKSNLVIFLMMVKKLRGIDIKAGDKILDSTLASATSSGNLALSALVNMLKLDAFVFFQQWREAVDLVRKAGNIRLLLLGMFASVRYTFLEALTYLKAAQSASGWKKRQMKKSARETIQIIKGWAKNGNVNVVHHLYILEAELAVLNRKIKKAKGKFNDAIVTSSRNGFLQDRALAHELAGAFFKAQGDDNWEKYHIDRSIACYQEWGCSEKVMQLSKQLSPM